MPGKSRVMKPQLFGCWWSAKVAFSPTSLLEANTYKASKDFLWHSEIAAEKPLSPVKNFFKFFFPTDIETLLKTVRDGQFLQRPPLCLAYMVSDRDTKVQLPGWFALRVGDRTQCSMNAKRVIDQWATPNPSLSLGLGEWASPGWAQLLKPKS